MKHTFRTCSPYITVLLFFYAQILHCRAENDSTESLIARLSSPKIQDRKQAEIRLLEKGDPALVLLKRAMSGTDPEIAMRAEIVIDKIEMGIHPKDEPELINLIEKFYTMNQKAQNDALETFRKRKKYRFNTLLAERAKNPNDQARLRHLVRYDAILETRMLIAADRVDDAEKWLRMLCEKDANHGMPLAYLLANHGSPQNEIDILEKKNDQTSKKLLAAYYRAVGNRQQTLRIAHELNDTSLVSMVELLNGNHAPLLDQYSRKKPRLKPYCALVENARKALPLAGNDLQKLLHSAHRDDERAGRMQEQQALFALGYEKQGCAVEKAEDPFLFYALQERDADALAAYGLKGENPDFKSFIEERLESLLKNNYSEASSMISWLEKRGRWDILDRDVIPQLIEFSREHHQEFDFFATTSLRQAHISSYYFAPLTMAKVFEAIAADDAIVWQGLIAKSRIGLPPIYMEDEGMNHQLEQWWQWLGEIEPAMKYADRFRLLIKCFLLATDPDGQREKTLGKILTWHKDASPQAREEKLPLLRMLQLAAPSKRLATIIPEIEQNSVEFLMQNKQWQQAADKMAALVSESPENPNLVLQQALCLKMAGKKKEAEALEKLFRLLVLGDASSCWFASYHYAQFNMIEDALEWGEKALFISRPNREFSENTEHFAKLAMESGKWQLATAFFEASLIEAVDRGHQPSIQNYRTRMHANMSYGFSLATVDRKDSLRILKACHNSLLADASLADHFFPSLRLCGMMQEHQQWFEESWAAMEKQRERYPAYDNIYNSMAWLASRAQLRLGEAKTLSLESMKLRPDMYTYLDTMAETQFALRDRALAIKYSDESLFLARSSGLLDPQIVRQNFRFHTLALP